MARYESTFQCPDTGAVVQIRYAFGRLTADHCIPDLEDAEEGLDWWKDNLLHTAAGQRMDVETLHSTALLRRSEHVGDTERWCAKVRGRYPSLGEANEALRRAGVDGFDLLEAW